MLATQGLQLLFFPSRLVRLPCGMRGATRGAKERERGRSVREAWSIWGPTAQRESVAPQGRRLSVVAKNQAQRSPGAELPHFERSGSQTTVVWWCTKARGHVQNSQSEITMVFPISLTITHTTTTSVDTDALGTAARGQPTPVKKRNHGQKASEPASCRVRACGSVRLPWLRAIDVTNGMPQTRCARLRALGVPLL